MAQSRLALNALLQTLTDNVYFQPPSNYQIKYPCIVYSRDGADTKFADDTPYLLTKRYQVTVIDEDPDSDIPDKVAQLPWCVQVQNFISDNLHHAVFSLFF